MTARAILPRLIATHRQRYVIIACICAGSHNAIMIGGDLIGGSYVPLTIASFLAVTPAAYALHARFTFARRWSLHGLLRFASGTALALPISLAVMAMLCTWLKLPMIVAAPIATIILFVWNYVSARLSIVGHFRRRT